MPAAPHPFDQSSYQVRLDWGLEGLARVAPAEIVVIVDVLRFSSTVARRLAADAAPVALDETAHAVSLNGAALAKAAADPRVPAEAAAGSAAGPALVVLGGLVNASAVARFVADEQQRAGQHTPGQHAPGHHTPGQRTRVTVIAAGERVSREPGASLRFAVEDLFGAGAIIDALGRLGIDHTSPEAAAATESFRALRPALRHLLSASGSGRELAATDADGTRAAEVAAAAELDAVDAVPVLRDGRFVRA